MQYRLDFLIDGIGSLWWLIWTLVPLFMIQGGLQLEAYLRSGTSKAWVQMLAWFIFFGSFLVEPVNQLWDSKGSGKEIHRLAEKLKLENGAIRFTSNDLTNECQVLAYLSGSSYYEPLPLHMPPAQQLKLMQDMGVAHFLFFYRSEEEKVRFLQDLPESASPDVREMGGNCMLVRLYFPSK